MYADEQMPVGQKNSVLGMTFNAGTLPAQLTVVPCVRPGRTCAESQVLMARARASGTFELLTGAAWAHALGYLEEELTGRSLQDLMELGSPVPGDVVAVLLDDGHLEEPIEVVLCCKGERRKRYRLHRRFDDYGGAMFLVADELSPTPENPGAALSPGK